MKRLNDDKEGEELQDILLIKDSDKAINTGIINKQNDKISLLETHIKSNYKKQFRKRCIILVLFIIFIIILVIVVIFVIFQIIKYLYKKPPKVEKYNECKWFIDGKSYFEDLYQKLMEANNTIYISDWWLSPEVFLLRPVDVNPYLEMVKNKKIINNEIENMTRLMDILNYKANQGVQIYILIYNEFSVALSLNSAHTEEILTKLNKNIKVTNYPFITQNFMLVFSDYDHFLWSDHEN